MCSPQTLLSALSKIRAPRTTSEYDLHALVTEALCAAGIPFRHEAPIAPRRRIDFLCGNTGVEVKRGRPLAQPLVRQLRAYAQSEEVGALVLVAEHPPRLAGEVGGKPLYVVSLYKLWGIAL